MMKLDAQIETALDAFWHAAYEQGRDQRDHDDEDGTAQKAEEELREAITNALIAASPTTPGLDVRWPIDTDDQVEALARECSWDNRRYMTLADYSIWCERMRKFARLASPSLQLKPTELEWKVGSDRQLVASTDRGTYTIESVRPGYKLFTPTCAGRPRRFIGLTDAKYAAQSEYEAPAPAATPLPQPTERG